MGLDVCRIYNTIMYIFNLPSCSSHLFNVLENMNLQMLVFG